MATVYTVLDKCYSNRWAWQAENDGTDTFTTGRCDDQPKYVGVFLVLRFHCNFIFETDLKFYYYCIQLSCLISLKIQIEKLFFNSSNSYQGVWSSIIVITLLGLHASASLPTQINKTNIPSHDRSTVYPVLFFFTAKV